MKQTAVFEKVLYRPQPFPDNYTDHNLFLKSLIKNKNLHIYSFRDCCNRAQLPLQQICGTLIFILLHYTSFSLSEPLLYLIAIITALGYILLNGVKNESVRTVFLFGGFIFGLAPIIQTLTSSISDDTVYAMAIIGLSVNFIFHNYDTARVEHMSECVSLNAAIFSAVCLASRADLPKDVLGTILMAVLIYGLMPTIRKKMFEVSIFPLYTLVLVSATFSVIWVLAPFMLLPFLYVIVVSMVVVPALFVMLQKRKDNIYGPWDEAELMDISSAGRDLAAE